MLVGIVALGFWTVLTAAVVGWLVAPGRRAEVAAVPELGGQPVPEEVIEIAFDQRYDVHTSIYGVEAMTFLNCKIVGFTGRKGATAAAAPRGGMSAMLSGSESSYRDHFDHWLVLEQADRRLLYLPPNSVKYIEQAAPGAK